jgi:phage shock protein E
MKNQNPNPAGALAPGPSMDQLRGPVSRRMWYLLILFVIGVVGIQILRAANRISDEQARELLKKGALVVDVRTEAEYASGSVKGSTNVPLDRFEASLSMVAPDKSKPLLLHCRSGMRSASALKIARQLGYTNAYNLGGFDHAQKMVEESR